MGIRTFLHFQIVSRPTGDLIRRVLIGLLIATIFLAGIELRRWIGENTRHVRYQHDLINGFYWGSEVLMRLCKNLAPPVKTVDEIVLITHVPLDRGKYKARALSARSHQRFLL